MDIRRIQILIIAYKQQI